MTSVLNPFNLFHLPASAFLRVSQEKTWWAEETAGVGISVPCMTGLPMWAF